MKFDLIIERIGGRPQGGPPTAVMLHKMLTRPGGLDVFKSYTAVKEWVAEVKPGFTRLFLKGKYDCSNVDETGMRGIYTHFVLEEGRIYEVCAPLLWGEKDRYLCVVSMGKIKRISKEEAIKCLKHKLE